MENMLAPGSGARWHARVICGLEISSGKMTSVKSWVTGVCHTNQFQQKMRRQQKHHLGLVESLGSNSQQSLQVSQDICLEGQNTTQFTPGESHSAHPGRRWRASSKLTSTLDCFYRIKATPRLFKGLYLATAVTEKQLRKERSLKP